MIEKIRTFDGIVRGVPRNRKLVVIEGFMYRCTNCGIIWRTKDDTKAHNCTDKDSCDSQREGDSPSTKDS